MQLCAIASSRKEAEVAEQLSTANKLSIVQVSARGIHQMEIKRVTGNSQLDGTNTMEENTHRN